MDGAEDTAEERIKALEKQRAQDLEDRRWMASCPERHHSFGTHDFFEKKINEKYDKYIGNVRRKADDAPDANSSCITPDREGRHNSKRRREDTCNRRRGKAQGGDDDSCSLKSVESRFSASCSDQDDSDASYMDDGDDDGKDSDSTTSGNAKSPDHDGCDESDAASRPVRRGMRTRRSNRTNNAQEVIEIDSSSDEDLDPSPDDKSCSGSDAEGNHEQEGGVSSNNSVNNDEGTQSSDESQNEIDQGGDGSSNNNALNDGSNSLNDDATQSSDESQNKTLSRNNDNGNVEESQSEHYPDASGGNNGDDGPTEYDDEYDSDGEDPNEEGELERYHVSKIKESKLTMAAQGFRKQLQHARAFSAAVTVTKQPVETVCK